MATSRCVTFLHAVTLDGGGNRKRQLMARTKLAAQLPSPPIHMLIKPSLISGTNWYTQKEDTYRGSLQYSVSSTHKILHVTKKQNTPTHTVYSNLSQG